MISNQFFRVYSDEYSSWDQRRAVMVNYEKGDWCIYTWASMDKLLILDYFNGDGDFVEWEGYYFGENPLPTMWDECDHRTEEPWFELDFAA